MATPTKLPACLPTCLPHHSEMRFYSEYMKHDVKRSMYVRGRRQTSHVGNMRIENKNSMLRENTYMMMIMILCRTALQHVCSHTPCEEVLTAHDGSVSPSQDSIPSACRDVRPVQHVVHVQLGEKLLLYLAYCLSS